jgi:hypothetical protein
MPHSYLLATAQFLLLRESFGDGFSRAVVSR